MKTKLKQREVNLYSQQSGPCCSQKQDKTSTSLSQLCFIPYTLYSQLCFIPQGNKGKAISSAAGPSRPVVQSSTKPNWEVQPTAWRKELLSKPHEKLAKPNQDCTSGGANKSDTSRFVDWVSNQAARCATGLNTVRAECFEMLWKYGYSFFLLLFLYRNFDKEPYKCF